MKIHTIDLHFRDRRQAIASYLVEAPEGPVLVECGPDSTLPRLRRKIQDLGFGEDDIRHLLVTHIHLDHAGCAGWWAGRGTTVYVHRIGAPHLIDPSKLLHSAGRIYGDLMDKLWGQVLPCPRENVVALKDGDVVEAAGARFTALETQGHASHHHTFRLGDIAFTGDAAGIRLPGTDLVDLPAPPPEFDLRRWLTTVDRLLAENFQTIYPTHFGRVDDVRGQLITFKRLLRESTQFIQERLDSHSSEDLVRAYKDWNFQRARDKGLTQETISRYQAANPLEMSVTGILRYLNKLKQRQA